MNHLNDTAERDAWPIARLIGVGFGFLWAVIGVMSLPSTWRLVAAIVAAVIGAGACAAAISRRGRRGLFVKSAYRVAVFLEVGAIMAASYLLPLVGLSGWFIQVVGVLVGLHFIGLQIAASDRRYGWLAFGMTAASIFAMALPRTTGALHTADAFTGWALALMMWFASAARS